MGNGELPVKELPDKIEIPNSMLFNIDANSMLFNIDDSTEQWKKTSLKQFVHIIFPDMNAILNGQLHNWIQWLSERAIMVPKTQQWTHAINNIVVSQCIVRPSVQTLLLIKMVSLGPVEYLNTLTPAGLPPHRLILKKCIILILL